MQIWVYWFLGDLGFWLQPFILLLVLCHVTGWGEGAIQLGCHCMGLTIDLAHGGNQ